MDTLAPSHLIFASPLFTQRGLIEELEKLVLCGLSKPDEDMQPTGVPPHIVLLNDMKELARKANSVIPEVRQSVKQMTEDVVQRVQLAANPNVVMRNGIEATMMNCLQSI
jgi:hypothetical protein